ncbi:MAG: hypothetical protein KJZ83_00435 [Burkholderiaceae bacterium]|nr:hypothetical protein [Burkholderiaceae bacterium]
MPLVLSMKESDDFWVEDRQVVITRIESGARFWVRLAGEQKEIEITDTEAKEIMDDVFVSAGDFYKYGAIRIAIEAPQEIEILRGDRYRKRSKSGP